MEKKDAIDLERVVRDPEYRRAVIEQLKAVARQGDAPVPGQPETDSSPPAR
jgi:hypothetical protein